jgi:hypothetical protein
MNLARQNVVLLVAAAVLAVPTWMQLAREGDAFTDFATIPLLFDGFTADNVGTILLGRPKAEQPPPDPQRPDQKRAIAYDQVQLQRSDKGWQIGALLAPGQPPVELAGAPVNKDRVESDVFLHLRQIRSDREALVQANATDEQLKSYGLDQASAFVIKALDRTAQNVVAELYVGRDAGEGQTGSEAVKGVFVRKGDTADVVLYEFTEKVWRREVTVDQWLDKLVLRLEPDKVTALSLRNAASAGTVFSFVRTDGKASWQAVDAPAGLGAVRQSEIEVLVQRLRYVAVQEFRTPLARAGNLETLGLKPGQIEVRCSYKDGDQDRTVTLVVGNKVDGKNECYFTSSDSPFLMTWAAGMVTPFERDPKELFDPPAPTPPEPAPDDKKDADKKDGEKRDEKK